MRLFWLLLLLGFFADIETDGREAHRNFLDLRGREKAFVRWGLQRREEERRGDEELTDVHSTIWN